MARVYAVASAKGGVGKTTTTAALATILSAAGSDVVAVDADIGMANLAGVLGIDIGETTVHDVLAGHADPSDAVHEGPAGLRVVPGETDLDAYAEADPSGIRDVVAAFDDADYVFIDAGAGLSHDSSMPLALADETLLVSTPERGALGDTEKTRQLTERLGGSVAGAALTRVDPEDSGPELAEALLDAGILGRIPEDDAVSRAGRAREPLVTFAPNAPATAAYRELARELTGEPIADPAPDTPEREDDDDAEAIPDATTTVDEKSAEEHDTGDEDAPSEDTAGEEPSVDEDAAGEEPSADEDATDEDPSVDEDATDDATDVDHDGDSEHETDPEKSVAAEDGVDGEAAMDAIDEAEPGDVDDELADSIPFQDDDSETGGTMLADQTDGEGAAGSDEADDEDAVGSDESEGAADSDETDGADGESEKKGGFFSRLFGR